MPYPHRCSANRVCNQYVTIDDAGSTATATIYAGVGFAACGLAIAGWILLPQKSGARRNAEETQVHASAVRPSPELGRQRSSLSRSSGSVPEVYRPAANGPQLAVLEGQLRSAIFSGGARERLVQVQHDH
jgi:hypothetical protein